jgi:hypothetical protein
VKGHAGGSLTAGKDPDFFFDGDVPFGPSRGILNRSILPFTSSDGHDFA